MKSYEKAMPNNCQFICWKVNRRVTNFSFATRKSTTKNCCCVIVRQHSYIYTFFFSIVSPISPQYPFFFAMLLCVVQVCVVVVIFPWILRSWSFLLCIRSVARLFIFFIFRSVLIGSHWQPSVRSAMASLVLFVLLVEGGNTQIQFHCIYKY